MKRTKIFLKFGILTGAALLAYAWAGERPRLRLQPYQLHWPPGAGLKILHLSDQHFGKDNWVQRLRFWQLKSVLSTLHPDLILMTGDFLHDDAGLTATERLLQWLPPARLGVYAVLGNHDYAAYSYGELLRNIKTQVTRASTPAHKVSNLLAELRRIGRIAWTIYRNERIRFAAVPNNTAELRHLLEAYGVQILDNRAVPLPEHPAIWLAGVDDVVEGDSRLDLALRDIPEEARIILLTHNPDVAYNPAAKRIDLVFSGHTHGGQVVLPGLGALHTQGTRLPRDHAAGLFADLPGGGKMIVSRGMGESTPFRLGCPPELVWVEVFDFTHKPMPE